ncbi:UNVERIFIED_ORG: hypothetical protein ABIB52_000751 [Arthrobacter sp. UYCu721]
MLINQTTYTNDGELLAPRPSDLMTIHALLGGMPTTEAGFYHRFKFEAPDAAQLAAKTKRFFGLMGQVPGFSTLSLRPYEVRFGNYYRTGLDIVYVVERACVGVR